MTSSRRVSAVVLAAVIWSLSEICFGDEINHMYKPGDPVELWVNKVGPYANPQEAYEYYTLPYCAPKTSKLSNTPKSHSLSEILGGHSLRHSGHDLHFAPPGAPKTVEECTTTPLTEDQAKAFAHAVEEQWFYQMYLDDLPVWGMVGEMLPAWDINGLNAVSKAMEERNSVDKDSLLPYVYTERNLVVSYNGERIVKVDLTSDPASLRRVEPRAELNFKLFVEWKETEIPFHSRFDRYLDHAFFKHQIHWFSIFNSFMMVLFLTGLVALIFLRTLRKDYARYARQAAEELSLVEEGEKQENEKNSDSNPMTMAEDSGWKQVHGDVFRAPPYLILLSAIIGTGSQFIVLTFSVILFAVAGPLHGDVYEERGEILHAILIFYALSSIVAGYASGSYFKMYWSTSTKSPSTHFSSSQAWQTAMGLTVLLLPTISIAVLFCLNIISAYYGTINTIPFLAIVKLFFLWIFISVPLCVVGTLIGRHTNTFSKSQTFPCRVNAIPRPIPENAPWYGQPLYLIPLSGILPFGSIFIELYYILTSLWNYKFYHVYGFMLGMYAILIIVVSMTSIISTYFCLNAENYHWQWNAFFSGASTSLYVFLYGVYYFLFKTNMHGLLQTSFYFGYMLLIAICFGMLCGTLGHWSSSRFVKTIFRNVKVD